MARTAAARGQEAEGCRPRVCLSLPLGTGGSAHCALQVPPSTCPGLSSLGTLPARTLPSELAARALSRPPWRPRRLSLARYRHVPKFLCRPSLSRGGGWTPRRHCPDGDPDPESGCGSPRLHFCQAPDVGAGPQPGPVPQRDPTFSEGCGGRLITESAESTEKSWRDMTTRCNMATPGKTLRWRGWGRGARLGKDWEADGQGNISDAGVSR